MKKEHNEHQRTVCGAVGQLKPSEHSEESQKERSVSRRDVHWRPQSVGGHEHPTRTSSADFNHRVLDGLAVLHTIYEELRYATERTAWIS